MFFVVGTGHCGTQWMSHVLTDSPTQLKCFHEYRNGYYKINWKEGIRRHQTNGVSAFKEYFAFMDHHRALGWQMGDSNSWGADNFVSSKKLQDMEGLVEVEKVLYLIRDGVLTVNSKVSHQMKHASLQQLVQTAPGEFEKRKRSVLRWEEQKGIKLPVNAEDLSLKDPQALNYLTAIIPMIQWDKTYSEQSLAAAQQNLGDRLSVWSLEKLTTQVSVMQELYELFEANKPEKEIKKLQKTDINQKIKNRKLETISDSWSSELKRLFVLICEETMLYHGYQESLATIKGDQDA